MAQELPYLPSYKNVDLLFSKIAAAKQPDAFTTRYLSDTLGLKSAGDRALIALLKTLGFLDGAGRPTAAYGHLKNPRLVRAAIAKATRSAYGPLFSANEKANELSPQDLNGLISQVAGTDSGITGKIAGTFRALVKAGDFTADLSDVTEKKEEEEEKKEEHTTRQRSKLSPEFHYNIQIHLPTNATEETYLNIFNALRKAFQ
jgi:hypothetical protein